MRNSLLSPTMSGPSELRWRFIRKIYSIMTIQLLATIAVTSVVLKVDPIADFFASSVGGLALYSVIIIIPVTVMCSLYFYNQRYPVNYLLLGLFTVTFALSTGLTCALIGGKVNLEAAILSTAVVVSLILYTFWAPRRGHEFNFLGPFLFGSLIVFIVFGFIQVVCPLGKLSLMIYGCLVAIVFWAYIVYAVGNIIKSYSYDEYIFASVAVYFEFRNIFSLLTFRGA